MRAQNRRNPAYPAMLAHDWNKKGQPDPKGYWASEKYDGLRALWDGENFYSRNGKIFHAPQWFKDTLPNTPLDGELWGERSVAGFQKAVSAVRKKVGGKEWENITYMVFDIPTSKAPFEKVQAKLKRMDLGPYGAVAPQYKIKSKSDMLQHFDKAVKEGAEGIMLRKPSSKYSPTRSASLLKVKPTDSSEAVVTGYQAGTGKHRGRMGAVHVYLLGDKSKVFKIGTGFSDRERESPPPIGSIVEFKFNDKTARGIPRFPAFLRIRTDMMADRPKRKAAKPARKKTMAKKIKWPERVGYFEGGEWESQSEKRGIPVGNYMKTIYGYGDDIGAEHYGDLKMYVAVAVQDSGAVTMKLEGYGGTKRKQFSSLDAAFGWLDGLEEREDPTYKPKPKPKPKRKAPAQRKARKPAAKSSRTAADYFSMGSADLVSLGDAGAKKELKRRGRDPRTGKKVRR